jgi:hypothetical protein
MTLEQNSIELRDLLQHLGTAHSRNTMFASPIPPPSPSTPSAEQVYRSAPLGSSPTTIRVLDVARQREDGSSVIQTNLRVVDLADKPTFTALSYVWGDSAQREIIWCGMEALNVTRSAWEALRRLRDHHGPLCIWIDAICINQADEAEKARQIPLMREIYSSALHVYVWLGEGNEKTERAMQHLASGALPFKWLMNQHLADLTDECHDNADTVSQIPTGSRMRWRLIAHYAIRRTLFLGKLYLHAELEELFSNPWIERVWTLQEVLLAETPILVCGRFSLSWLAFLAATEVFEFHRTGARYGTLVPRGLPLPPSFEPWLQLSAIWKSWRKNRSNMQGLSRRSECDKTFLELHMDQINQIHSSRAAMWLPATMCLVAGALICVVSIVPFANFHHRWPSYMPIAIIFGLAILGLVMLAKSPSLSVYQREMPWKFSLTTQIATRHCTVPEDVYYGVLGIIRSRSSSESHESLPTVRSRVDAYRSLCLGLVSWSESLDFLLFVPSEKSQGKPSWVVQWDQVDPLWTRYLYGRDLVTHDLERYPGQHIRGATPGSKVFCIWDRRASDQLSVHAVFLTNIDWRTWTDPGDSQKIQRTKLWEQMFTEDGVCTTDYPYHDQSRTPFHVFGPNRSSFFIQRAIEHDRSVIRWRRTHFTAFGLAPRETQIGDRLALISGLSMPMLLRHISEHFYEVIGPAFMNGLMNGEHWPKDPEQVIQKITLV